MSLVREDRAPARSEDQGLGPLTWKNYVPLLVVITLLLTTAGMVAYRDVTQGVFSWSATATYFMIGFFLTFGGFKLLDLKGFAEGYSTYDLLSQRFFGYGYVYPFIELFFAFAMILSFQMRAVLWTELIVMIFSGVGVALKMVKREQIHCVCLGTVLKVPLTSVTLIEDFGMAALAALLLFWR
ncbi:MAG: hypothetical protein HYR90_01845 [Candidatus Andersenbacteria bacterium]|nr:hypothetical protein [Candidatus Andersenbacteria bacterium]